MIAEDEKIPLLVLNSDACINAIPTSMERLSDSKALSMALYFSRLIVKRTFRSLGCYADLFMLSVQDVCGPADMHVVR